MNNTQINEMRSLTKNSIKNYKISSVEGSFVMAFIKANEITINDVESDIINFALKDYCDELVNQILSIFENISIEVIADLFELLLEDEFKTENGVVFTPSYIVDYIARLTLDEHFEDMRIIDPACGTGIFLFGAAEYIQKTKGFSYRKIVEEFLYGIDLHDENIYRTKLILALLLLKNGDYGKDPNYNLVAMDSLNTNWMEVFNCEGFDFVIGNPPYVNTHDMNKETIAFLKKSFSTTKSGVFNIFYAFIEHSFKHLKDQGKIGFIVPNNFLTIKAAEGLRGFIQKNKCLELLIDFDHNMIFKPVRTYNVILVLSKSQKETFKYSVMKKVEDIEMELKSIHFHTMQLKRLDKNGWKLIDELAYSNVMKIEGHFHPIKEFIRTGIATLRDAVFIIEDRDEHGYYKKVLDRKIYIEEELIRKLYKIPDIKEFENIQRYQKAIIFPYKKSDSGYKIIDEQDLKVNYPNTYEYLLSSKSILDERDKGKPNSVAWYAYGRTQGLNKYGKKLLFPTFSNEPRFIMEEDDQSLFCNGYAVFENDYVELEVLQKILNSKVMKFYIDNTSYSIEGGYRCYQKKYIENFSIPIMTTDEIKYVKEETDKARIDQFLFRKYGLEIEE